jgi:hypothetical protein
MVGHRFHGLVFVGAQSDALPIRKHEPLMTANFPDFVLSHLPCSAGWKFANSRQRTPEELAVNRV